MTHGLLWKTLGRGLAAAALAAGLAPTATALVTMEEAQEGWISLFDGETTFGWREQGEANWSVSEGVLACDAGAGGLLATTTRFQDFEVMLRVKLGKEANCGIAVRASLEGHYTENGSAVATFSGGEKGDADWRDLHFVVQGNSVTVNELVDGAWKPATLEVANLNAKGRIGLMYYGKGKLEVSDVKLRPLEMRPVFNGENLDGWNILPDHKSVFSVIDGALNIKDGNGQIETDELFEDFLFQLSIISNGEHLNSGVFFRGPKGVFWKGYESQVRNQWRGDDRTQPVDFGTAGIYARQAARKVVSTDGEWFHKTIVCDDDHISTWINGYQVGDLLETRPPVDNGDGKAGYVSAAGTIHLQGHDPTTDLSFKGMRIQTYGK